MRYRQTVPVVFILIFLAGVTVKSQTPASAAKYYEHGASKFERGDLDGALADYTRAIEISSHLSPAKSRSLSSANAFDAAEADRIGVIDPITARAYTNRGIVRLRKDDVDGAISDLDQAIRINSGLAEAHLARGVAQRRRGDSHNCQGRGETTIA